MGGGEIEAELYDILAFKWNPDMDIKITIYGQLRVYTFFHPCILGWNFKNQRVLYGFFSLFPSWWFVETMETFMTFCVTIWGYP